MSYSEIGEITSKMLKLVFKCGTTTSTTNQGVLITNASSLFIRTNNNDSHIFFQRLNMWLHLIKQF